METLIPASPDSITSPLFIPAADNPRISFAMCMMAIFLMLSGCSGANIPESSSSKNSPGSGSDRTSPTKISGVAGRVGEFQLTDQSGRPVSDQDLNGKVWIATFVFTRCTLTCPLQSRWMVRLQDRLRQEPSWDDIRFVTISVDPEYDTPEILKSYAESLNADPEHWMFLTGNRDTIWSLARNSFHFATGESADESTPIAHDPRVVLIDRRGQIRSYYDVIAQESLEPVLRGLSTVLPEFDPPAELWPHDSAGDDVTHLAQPPEILNSEGWMAQKRDEQISLLSSSDVFHQFSLQNRLKESGITFRNQILDEQRSRLEVNHFDHGNGICAADVDGDGLPDLYFVNQAGPNALYRNLGNGRFEDITEAAGVAVNGRVKVSASFADVNNDGRPDLFVTTVRGGNVLFLNEGDGRFRDVSQEYGVDYSGHSSAAVFFDYDRDGFVDLFVCNVGKYTTEEVIRVRDDRTTALPAEGVEYFAGMKDAFAGHLKPALAESSILYRNEGGQKFVDVTEECGLRDTGWSGAALPADLNGDGWIDLYTMNMQGHDSYFENQQGRTFLNRTHEFFQQTPWGTMGGSVFDMDQDGRFDLMLTDMHSDMSETVSPSEEKKKANIKWPESFLKSESRSIYGNAFFHNRGDGRFDEISDAVGAENFWPWGMSVGDLNADGFPDVLITSGMCFPYRYAVNTLLLNDAGKKLLDSEFVVGLEPRSGPSLIPWFELDCEGADAANPLCRDRKGKRVVWSSPGSRSSILIDLDQDGDLDIVTNDFNTPPLLLLSDLSERLPDLRFLSIRLTGSRSNRDGLGSRVTVTAGGRDWHQVHDGQSGYLSQSCVPLYFGLPGNAEVERIVVHWPSGAEQIIEGPLETNTQLDITEPRESI